MTERTVQVDDLDKLHALFGDFDSNIGIIQKEYGVSVFSRDGIVKIVGQEDRAQSARKAVEGLLDLIERGETVNDMSVRYVIGLVNDGNEEQVSGIGGDTVCVTFT